MRTRIFALAAGVAALGWFGAHGQTATPSPGRATAASFAAVTPGAALAVRPLDDSPLEERMQAALAAQLARGGWRVQAGGRPALALNFVTEVQPLGSRAAGPSFGRMSSGTSQKTEFAVNVYSNAHDSLVTGRRLQPGPAGVRYVLRATLDDEAGGRRLWQGEAWWDGDRGDERLVLHALAQIVSAMVGRTVRATAFENGDLGDREAVHARVAANSVAPAAATAAAAKPASPAAGRATARADAR